MTDGSVIVQDAGCPDWWRLTPDSRGCYAIGTWTQIASLPLGYFPSRCKWHCISASVRTRSLTAPSRRERVALRSPRGGWRR